MSWHVQLSHENHDEGATGETFSAAEGWALKREQEIHGPEANLEAMKAVFDSGGSGYRQYGTNYHYVTFKEIE